MAVLLTQEPSRKTTPLAQTSHLPISYRPDIDGLRTVAVLSVILFHLRYLKGGFVGVDIFFVISGFLITSGLWRDLTRDTYSVASFYERRIRRILPALFAMLAVVVVASYAYLLPGEFVDLSHTLLASLLSASNFFFWQKSGYFDSSSASNPLLHTWSLAVEEQFYFVFPLVLAFLYRRRPERVAISLCGLLLASLGLSVFTTRHYPNFAFYLPFTRAWELILGSVLSLVDLRFLRRRTLRNITALVGLALIAYALLRFTRMTVFPGYAATIPCLGAACLIAAGANGRTAVGRMLSIAPIRFTGLISYSLYLWHWPLIVFSDHGMKLTSGVPRPVSKLILFGLSYVLAVLSWKFVERPLRRSRPGSSRAGVFWGALAGGVAVALLAVTVLAAGGFPKRFSPRAASIADYQRRFAAQDRANYRMGTCFISSGDHFSDFQQDTCLRMLPSKTNVLLLGDSHAAQLYVGLTRTFPEVNWLQATSSGCKPFLTSTPKDAPQCRQVIDFALRSFVPAHRGLIVLLAARWSESDKDDLANTVGFLKQQGASTVVIGPIVQYDTPLPILLAMSMRQNNPNLAASHEMRDLRGLDVSLAQIATSRLGVPYVSYYPYLCKQSGCLTLLPGDVPLQDDESHLTEPGSLLIAQAWKKSKAFSPLL